MKNKNMTEDEIRRLNIVEYELYFLKIIFEELEKEEREELFNEQSDNCC